MSRPAPTDPTVVVDVDPPSWLLVPPTPEAVDQWREAAAALFAFSAEIDRTGGVTPPEIDVEAALDGLLAMAATLGSASRLAASLAVPGAWPLPVVVDAGLTGDDAPDLLELGRARGGTPLEAPLIDELPDDVGPGIVVTRFDLDDERDVWATVSCARRRDGLDVVALWRTNDLGLVEQFRDRVVELLGAVRTETVTDGGDA